MKGPTKKRVSPTLGHGEEPSHKPLAVNGFKLNQWKQPWLGGQLSHRQVALPGLTLGEFEGELGQTGALPQVGQGTGVTLLFVMRGSLQVRTQTQAIAQVDTHMHATYFPGNEAVEWHAKMPDSSGFWIEIEAQYFLSWMAECGDWWRDFGQQVQSGIACTLYPQAMPTDIALQACLRQLQRQLAAEAPQPLYLRAKAMEIMALQEMQWRLLHSPRPMHVKTDYDRERLAFARNYLEKNMAMPPTLVELASIAGINEFKLKRGFKELYGNTVFGYLADLRLSMALDAIQRGHKTATEIAFELGFSSLQHFSSRFKEKYGVTPTELRLQASQK